MQLQTLLNSDQYQTNQFKISDRQYSKHTCQLSRFRRETFDFEDFSRSPNLNKKTPEFTI